MIYLIILNNLIHFDYLRIAFNKFLKISLYYLKIIYSLIVLSLIIFIYSLILPSFFIFQNKGFLYVLKLSSII